MFLSKLTLNQKTNLFTCLGIIFLLALHIPLLTGKTQPENPQKAVSRITLIAAPESEISSASENSTNPGNTASRNNSNNKNPVEKSESSHAESGSSNSQQDKDNAIISDIVRLIEENKIYPRNARIRNMEGDVKVAFCVSKDGYLDGDVTIIESTAPVILQKAAVESVSRAFRKPYRKLFQNLNLQITIRYSLIR